MSPILTILPAAKLELGDTLKIQNDNFFFLLESNDLWLIQPTGSQSAPKNN